MNIFTVRVKPAKNRIPIFAEKQNHNQTFLVEGIEEDVSKSDRAMVALKAQRADRPVVMKHGAASGTGKLDIFVDEDAIEKNFFKSGVGDFLAVTIKAGSTEGYVEGLPVAGCEGGVDAWGMTFVTFGISFFIPAFVNAAALDAGIRGGLHLVTIEDLNLVLTLQINAGIRPLGNYEFEMYPDIAELFLGDNIFGLADGAIDKDAFSGFGREEFGIIAVERRITDDLPAGIIPPIVEIASAQYLLFALRHTSVTAG
jgi:hypothetical protein